MLAAGLQWIQVRAKRMADDALYEALVECARVTHRHGAQLWVNDRADLAAMVGADGVHVGQQDLPPAAVRRVVGDKVAIGCSTHNAEQFRAAQQDPDVDVIALGPIFDTTGKDDPDPTVGVELLSALRAQSDKPLVAIGGIDADNIAGVLGAGADSAAVLGAICRGDVERNCRRLLAAARDRELHRAR